MNMGFMVGIRCVRLRLASCMPTSLGEVRLRDRDLPGDPDPGARHPLHLGIIFLANLELGYLTPLVGLNLFFASYRFGKPVIEIFRAVLPLFIALGGVLAITYLPWLSTGLPGLAR